MKKIQRIRKQWFWVAAVVAVSVISSLAAPGDGTNLYEFGAVETDGSLPLAGLVEDGGLLYGMTPFGGSAGCGVIYCCALDGSGFTNLFSFSSDDGMYPLGRLIVDGGYLYGTTSQGGTNEAGVVFRVATNGAGFQVLHHFDDKDENNGASPWGSLVLSGGQLYGMTYNGGLTNQGVVFRLGVGGTGYTNLVRFSRETGCHPKGGLVVDGSRLYGMTCEGGANGNGIIFAVDTDGSDYTNLHAFAGGTSDGQNPGSDLLLQGDWLYGVTAGGAEGAGLVFRQHKSSDAYTVLRSFSTTSADGADPYAALLYHDSKLYGATRYGGQANGGLIMSMGGTYTNQYDWTGGGEPVGRLLAVGDALYGVTMHGGSAGKGTLFKVEMNTNDSATAWCAITWIDGGGMNDTLAGDLNSDRMYVQHNTAGGLPDGSYIGYGESSTVDDSTWTWLPMTNFGIVNGGSDYEFTGTLQRASAGDYRVAVKFVKGMHVYYPPADAFGIWGSWTNGLSSTQCWTVIPLTMPSNVVARYVDATSLAVDYDPDGTHWVCVFRKDGASPSFTPPADGTEYYTGTSYDDQGVCIYRGDVSPLSQTGLATLATYHYRLYTENYNYYSTGAAVFASTDGAADDDADRMPNQWEVDYGLNPGWSADALADLDGDQFINWNEYIAGTYPDDDTSLLEVTGEESISNTHYTLTWSSVASKQYALWRSTNLVSGFSGTVASNITATPPSNTYTDDVAGAEGYFYRIEVQQ